jgi:hypothetical protein
VWVQHHHDESGMERKKGRREGEKKKVRGGKEGEREKGRRGEGKRMGERRRTKGNIRPLTFFLSPISDSSRWW